MMFVSALTIESPVTTVYRIAPKAAAAIVPIAYSTVDMPSSDSTTTTIRRRSFVKMLRINGFPPSQPRGRSGGHSTPPLNTSRAKPMTTGTMPRQTNDGRKHRPSGAPISTPARSAVATAESTASLRH